MDAPGVYSRAPCKESEEVPRLELMRVNARHVKNLPGRKTDVSDAAWVAQLAECRLLRGSFVPPPVITELSASYRRCSILSNVSSVSNRNPPIMTLPSP